MADYERFRNPFSPNKRKEDVKEVCVRFSESITKFKNHLANRQVVKTEIKDKNCSLVSASIEGMDARVEGQEIWHFPDVTRVITRLANNHITLRKQLAELEIDKVREIVGDKGDDDALAADTRMLAEDLWKICYYQNKLAIKERGVNLK